jgi:hypothetical protein
VGRGRPLGGHIGSVTGLAYGTDGRTAAGAQAKTIALWRLE